jgi:adenylate cyclase
MGGSPRAALARRAGVEVAYVDRLLDAGILVPGDDGSFREGAHRLIGLVRTLERSGLTAEAIGEAVRGGRFSFDMLDLPIYERFAPAAGPTFRELSARTGVPLDLLLVVREACGFGLARPDDPMREDEVEASEFLVAADVARYDAGVFERMLRVYGEALSRIVETESAAWVDQVVQPMIDAGVSEADALTRGARYGEQTAPELDRALVAMYHGHQGAVWARIFFELLERTLERAGVRPPAEEDPAICFLDISGYTELTEERGDLAAAGLAARLASLVRPIASGRDGRVVKWLGDGVMFHFDRPSSAVVAALDMVDRVSLEELPPAHVGLDAGPVILQDGDYFGRTVNIAARISARAGPGQVLASEAAVRSSGDVAGIAFEPVGATELKGVARPVTLYRVARGG